MLRKLYKHEGKEVGRLMLVLWGVMLAATAFVAIVCGGGRLAGEDHPVAQVMITLSMGVYIFTIIALAVTASIYICYRFYQTMYSSQGYLTHTLPLKETQILNTKIVVAVVALFATVLVILLSVLCVAASALEGGMPTVIKGIRLIVAGMAKDMRVSQACIVFFCAAEALLGCLVSLLMFFAGCSIGQLFHTSKGAWGIAASIGLYFATEIFSAIFLVVFVTIGWMRGTPENPYIPETAIMAFGILLPLLWAALYYVICRVVVKKHLNLS